VISTHRESQIAAASQALTAGGGKYVVLPTLLPASLVLELAGEGLRPRLFFATAPDGTELCLRPDLTIPAVVDYLRDAAYDDEPCAIACIGQVYRAPRAGEDRPPEFTQIGLERFGDPNVVPIDVTVFLAAWNAVKASKTEPLHVRFCDGGLLSKVIAEAHLPEIWRAALSEQTNHHRAFLATLNQASGQVPTRTLSALESLLVDLPFEVACAHVQAALSEQELILTEARSIEDVTRRMIDRACRAAAPPLGLDLAQTLKALATFRQIESLAGALAQIVALAGRLGVDLHAWSDDWRTRFADIEKQAPEALIHARFDAIGEEAFDYYDGMAFDIATSDDFARPVATGGRYDRLVGEISGGTRQARAIGCVIRPDRFAPDANGER
jgi:ATP phosphoribosyltransferase regulatory subunit